MYGKQKPWLAWETDHFDINVSSAVYSAFLDSAKGGQLRSAKLPYFSILKHEMV